MSWLTDTFTSAEIATLESQGRDYIENATAGKQNAMQFYALDMGQLRYDRRTAFMFGIAPTGYFLIFRWVSDERYGLDSFLGDAALRNTIMPSRTNGTVPTSINGFLQGRQSNYLEFIGENRTDYAVIDYPSITGFPRGLPPKTPSNEPIYRAFGKRYEISHGLTENHFRQNVAA